jgi:hypothetical protein
MQLHGKFHLEPETGEGRRAPRRTLRLEVESVGGSDSSSVVIHNISATGLLIETSAAMAIGDTFEVSLPERGATSVRVVWASGGFYGCEFGDRISEGTISAARLKAPGAARQEEASVVVAEAPEIEAEGLSLRSRLAIIVGVSAALWAMIIGAVMAFA